MKGLCCTVISSAVLMLAGCGELAVIKTNPSGAEIYCNGERLGTSPCNAPLPESEDGIIGMNVIEARLNGYMPEYYYLSGRPSDEAAGHIQPFSLSKPVIEIVLTKLPDDIKPESVPGVAKGDTSAISEVAGPYDGKASIEVRVVRASDGRVMGQICRYEAIENVTALAQSIVGELIEYLPASDTKPEIKVLTLRNRRRSDFGKKLTAELTEEIMRETCFSGGYSKVQTLNLRDVVEEDKLDNQATFTKIKKKGLLDEVDYVIMGGVAESIKP